MYDNTGFRLQTTGSRKSLFPLPWSLKSEACLLRRVDRGLDLVVLRLVARGRCDLTIANDALAIDDDYGAAGHALQAAHVRVDHVELLDGVLVEVAQQVEVERVLAGELLQRERRVHADAEHRRVHRVERGKLIAEVAELFLADRRERRREECEHHGFAGQRAERHRLFVLIGQSEIRGLGTYVSRHGWTSKTSILPRPLMDPWTDGPMDPSGRQQHP